MNYGVSIGSTTVIASLRVAVLSLRRPPWTQLSLVVVQVSDVYDVHLDLYEYNRSVAF